MLILKGFRFGMLLQLSVGPVFFFILQTAAQSGFVSAETGVLGVFLIDALYIFLAVAGVASVIEKKNIKSILKLAGAIVLFVFGSFTVLSAFNIHFAPAFSLQNTAGSTSVFVSALILTASSPITILFWAGVFSAKIAESGMLRKNVFFFAMGTALATLVFLSLTSLLGSIIGNVIPSFAVQIMNICVGSLLMFFGARMLFKKA
jgi:Putative threonine efflux protein